MKITSIKTPVVFSMLFAMLSVNACANDESILKSPIKIPFAKDVPIKKYVTGNPLDHFRHSGEWSTSNINGELSIIGKSSARPSVLISLDKLSRKPKSFVLDFIVEDDNKEYGFFYGETGVIIKNKKIFPALFDVDGNLIKITNDIGLEFRQGGKGEVKKMMINTGSTSNEYTLYINGRGTSLHFQNIDLPFGVYVGENNILTINNIRWNRSSM